MRAAVFLVVLAAVASTQGMRSFDLFQREYSNDRLARSLESIESSICSTLTCVNQGGNCTITSMYNVPLCLDGDCTNGLCPTVPGVGQTCTTICTAGNTCHPTGNICVSSGSINNPGGSCSVNTNCMFVNGTTTYGLCQSGTCFGLAIGASCTGDKQCSGRAYCNSVGVCAAYLADGATCSFSDTCVESDVCNSGKCTRIGSVASGGTCTASEACGDGYYCSSAGTCATPPTAGGSCSFNSDCPSGSNCGCTIAGGGNTTCVAVSGNPSGSTGLVASIGDCLASNNCADFECLQSKCASLYCKYRALALSEANQFPGCFASYQYLAAINSILPNIAACTSGASTAATSSALLMLMFGLFALLF